MRIHYSLTSPFARKVRIFTTLTQEPNIEWVLTRPMESPGFRRVNPLGKIPALEDNSVTLLDSTLICEYLDERHCVRGGASLFHRGLDYFDVQKMHYLANGIMDAAVAIVMDTRRADAQASPFWLKRWDDSITAALQAVTVNTLGSHNTINIGGISLVCALGYLALRLPAIDLAALNPELSKWYGLNAQQDWCVNTQPQDSSR